MTARLLAFLAALFLLAAPAAADESAYAAARSSIEGQLRAFLADDHDTAYGFAAPGIRRIFPTRDAFMDMVRNGYAPVHRPRSFAFGKVERLSDGQIMQQVLLVGPDGRDYEAVYVLELQEDGVYRITGVSLRAGRSLSS